MNGYLLNLLSDSELLLWWQRWGDYPTADHNQRRRLVAAVQAARLEAIPVDADVEAVPAARPKKAARPAAPPAPPAPARPAWRFPPMPLMLPAPRPVLLLPAPRELLRLPAPRALLMLPAPVVIVTASMPRRRVAREPALYVPRSSRRIGGESCLLCESCKAWMPARLFKKLRGGNRDKRCRPCKVAVSRRQKCRSAVGRAA